MIFYTDHIASPSSPSKHHEIAHDPACTPLLVTVDLICEYKATHGNSNRTHGQSVIRHKTWCKKDRWSTYLPYSIIEQKKCACEFKRLSQK